MSETDGQRARWFEHFEQLYSTDPTNGQLPTSELHKEKADSPIDESSRSHALVRDAMERLRDGKATGLFFLSADFPTIGGEAMHDQWVQSIVTTTWQSGTISLDWKRRMVIPI